MCSRIFFALLSIPQSASSASRRLPSERRGDLVGGWMSWHTAADSGQSRTAARYGVPLLCVRVEARVSSRGGCGGAERENISGNKSRCAAVGCRHFAVNMRGRNWSSRRSGPTALSISLPRRCAVVAAGLCCVILRGGRPQKEGRERRRAIPIDSGGRAGGRESGRAGEVPSTARAGRAHAGFRREWEGPADARSP